MITLHTLVVYLGETTVTPVMSSAISLNTLKDTWLSPTMNSPALPPRVGFGLRVEELNIFEFGAKVDSVPKINAIKTRDAIHSLKESIRVGFLAKTYINTIVHTKIIIVPSPKVASSVSYVETYRLTARFLYW